MTTEANILQKRIEELENSNALLLAQLEYNQKSNLAYKKDVETLIQKRTQEIEETNKNLQTAKLELEQYKNHLEEVIKERTLDLKTSEQRLISVSDSLTGGAIFEIRLSKDDVPWLSYLSKSISDLIGIEMNDMQNNFPAFEKTIHPEDIIRFREGFMKSKLTKGEFDVEVRFLQPEQPVKWLHLRANAIQVTKEYTIWVGIVFDTTEKNKYQQEIQEREAILNAIIENIPFDFWALDSNNICFLQNSASRKLWGNMIGKPIESAALPSKTILHFNTQISRVRQGEIINEETTLEDISNKKRDYQSLHAPILLHDKVRGFLCFNIDITERKKVEIARSQNEQKFRNIFDNSTDAVIIQTHTGSIIEMNAEFEKLIDYNSSNKKIKLSQLLEKKEKSQFFDQVNDIKNSSNIFIFETNFITLSNDVIPVEIKSKEIDYLDSTAILSLIRNTTYRKRFERQLVNAIIETEEKERARLAADLHDEIGPILSSMKMLTGLLIDTKDVAKAKLISTQIFELVTESIRSVRETSNSISPHVLKNYGIIAATKNIIQSMQHLIPINIDTNCEDKRFESTIEIIYYRVLREMLNNTIKHAQATKINVSLHLEEDILRFKYSDDGIGFNVREKTQKSSSGMGLYNIISRINSLDAHYNIESAEGEGTYFILETNILKQSL